MGPNQAVTPGPARVDIDIDRCASLRPGAVTSPTASAKHSLRTLAKRYQALDNEIREHDTILDDLTLAFPRGKVTTRK